MYTYNFFGTQIKRNDLGINSSFCGEKGKRYMWELEAMEYGTKYILNIY